MSIFVGVFDVFLELICSQNMLLVPTQFPTSSKPPRTLGPISTHIVYCLLGAKVNNNTCRVSLIYQELEKRITD